MRRIALLILCCLLPLAGIVDAASLPMRPYSGIGVVRISSTGLTDSLLLYDEPGLVRNGQLNLTAIQELTAWLFGPSDDLYLLVTARKGDWLRVERDDSGREGWLQVPRRGSYSPWDQFLKGKSVAFLRNAPKKLQQLHTAPGSGIASPVTTTAAMKVIMVQGDWTYVLFDRNSAGWIRWRDSDGRLLIGLAQAASTQSR